MPLYNRLLAVALSGYVTADDPHVIADAQAEMDRLRAALADARDALRNDFESENQSRAWHRANDALNRKV